MSHTSSYQKSSSTIVSACCAFLVGICLFYAAPNSPAQTTEFVVFGSELSQGFDMGVESSEMKRDWLKKGDGYMEMAYPRRQDWGAVFITVGKPRQPPRPSRDFSAFQVLSIEMKGETGDEQLEVGIKTNEQPDDGSEVKRPVKLTSQWQVYSFPLSDFEASLHNLYVVTEFVFSGTKAQRVFFRNVKFLAGAAQSGGDEVGSQRKPVLGKTDAPKGQGSNQTALPISTPTENSLIRLDASIIASALFGGFILLVLVVVLFLGRDLRPDQRAIVRLLMALAAAFFAVFFVGGVLMNGTVAGLALSATGGFVLFIFIFVSKVLPR